MPSVILACAGQVYCQNRVSQLSREISFSTDNDIYFQTDYYYTAGASVEYRRLASNNSQLFRRLKPKTSDSNRLIINYQLGSKIFNPRSIFFNDSKTTDRPYAGYSYIGLNLARFKSSSKGIDFGVELGVVGEITGLDQLQGWLHRQTHFLVPKGWDSQISNEMIINLNLKILRSVSIARGVDLISSSGVNAGTRLNRISQGFTFRFLQFNPISNSNYFKTNLSWDKSDTKSNREFFLFAGLGMDYTISNIFIEGSLFRFNRSPFTTAAVPLIFRTTLGLMYSHNRSSLSIEIHHLTKEVAKGTSHKYGTLAFGYRF